MKIRDAARATARVIGRTLKGALRVLSLLFVILVLAAGAAAYYVSQRFSPEDARRLAAEQMTALLHREVVINRLVLSPHGIKMLGLRVRRGGSEPDFVACDSALVTIRLRPLFDRRLEIGSWLDYGMFLQNVMVAARGIGLHTCPQAAFASMPNTVRAALGLPFQDAVVCGMAIGYADPDAVENTLRTTRVPAREFMSFAGFED